MNTTYNKLMKEIKTQKEQLENEIKEAIYKKDSIKEIYINFDNGFVTIEFNEVSIGESSLNDLLKLGLKITSINFKERRLYLDIVKEDQ